MADEEETELNETQKKEIGKWFLLNSPPGEIQYVAKGFVLILSQKFELLVSIQLLD